MENNNFHKEHQLLCKIWKEFSSGVSKGISSNNIKTKPLQDLKENMV